jgi:thioredoxin reductase
MEVVGVTDGLEESYDVVVVGGGAAGLNAALMLARARRTVLVVDTSEPRNAPADGVHGLLGHDGVPPAELLERGREEVRRYGGHVLAAEATGASGQEDDFVVTLADGRSVGARRLLITSGLVDQLPDVPGLRERWGRDVLHCPYCHGWEVRDRAIGVLAGGPMSVHQALLFRQWSADLVFLAQTLPVSEEEAEQLAARGTRVVEGLVESLEIAEDRLTGVRLGDGSVVPLEALVVSSRTAMRATGVLAGLGLRASEHSSGMGEYVPTDDTGRTDVPGVWAAGNVTDLAAQVGAAAAGGAFAAAQLNADLVMAETRAAVADRRASRDEEVADA